MIAQAARQAAEHEWRWIATENRRNLQWLVRQGMVLSEPDDGETQLK